MKHPFIHLLTSALLALLTATGCGGDTAPDLPGRWQVVNAFANGRQMTAGGDWFEFRDGGAAVSKLGPGPESKGTWKTEPEKHTLVLGSETAGETRYDYRMHGDTLVLKTVAGKGHEIEFQMVKEQGNE